MVLAGFPFMGTDVQGTILHICPLHAQLPTHSPNQLLVLYIAKVAAR
jgi:hypothetical protein